jgi:lipase ATG15
LRRKDIHPDTLVATEETKELTPRPKYTASSQLRAIKRLRDRSKDTMEAHLLNHRYGLTTSFAAESWATEEISQPNITDKETVLTMAKIAADAYVKVEHTQDWLDVGSKYNLTDDFGWDSDGLRGHIFADETNSTVIIGLKGTSGAVFDGADTATNDKINDNLLFSCCCARVGMFWSTVCDCYTGTAYTCNKTCLKKELNAENRYYRAALQLYYNVTTMYPGSNIWVVGHSLGGSMSSLLGQTYGLPVVTFEAPGEAMASDRIGLPLPPDGSRQSTEMAVYHFGHTADPLYMGTCNGPTSACNIAGYAMESHCHAGMECIYDVVSDWGWRSGLGYHRIQGVIRDVIEKYDTVPKCVAEPGCVDCFNWNWVEGNATAPTTTITTKVPPSTTSQIPTTTCHTPGWWGCRDITTTSGMPTTTTTTQTPTETCSHYGWFGGCLDPTSTTTTTTTTTPATITTTTSPPSSTTITASETCSKYGWFGGCIDPTETPTATPQPTPTQSCEHRALWGIGWCTEWSEEPDEEL